jgi:hypothetical protein
MTLLQALMLTLTFKGLSLQDNVNENIVTFGDVVIES